MPNSYYPMKSGGKLGIVTLSNESAKEMFEKLGYELIEISDKEIWYKLYQFGCEKDEFL